MTQQDRSTLSSDVSNYKAPPKSDKEALKDNQQNLVDSYFVREISLSSAAESTDDIDVTVQLKDSDGSTDLGKALRCRAEIINTDGLIASDTEFRITGLSTGTAIAPSSTLDDPALIFETDTNGKAVMTVHDQAGASDQDVYVVVNGLEGRLPTQLITLTFDAS